MSTKANLRTEINRYIAFGYSVEAACMQVNNLHLNKHLHEIYTIQKELLAGGK